MDMINSHTLNIGLVNQSCLTEAFNTERCIPNFSQRAANMVVLKIVGFHLLRTLSNEFAGIRDVWHKGSSSKLMLLFGVPVSAVL